MKKAGIYFPCLDIVAIPTLSSKEASLNWRTQACLKIVDGIKIGERSICIVYQFVFWSDGLLMLQDKVLS